MKRSSVHYDFDIILSIPVWLRLRTLQALVLGMLALSIVAALEWPQAWRLIELGDLAAASLLLAMAACREWLVRAGRRACLFSGVNLQQNHRRDGLLAVK